VRSRDRWRAGSPTRSRCCCAGTGVVRQLTILDLWHEEPTVLVTNHTKAGPAGLVTRYAQIIWREYACAQPKRTFRNLLDLSGRVDIGPAGVVMTFDKRAHDPMAVNVRYRTRATPQPRGCSRSLIVTWGTCRPPGTGRHRLRLSRG